MRSPAPESGPGRDRAPSRSTFRCEALLTNSTPRSWNLEGLRLGIALGGPHAHDDWLRIVDWVEWAEARGLHSVWLPEMHFVAGACSSPLTTLAGIAGRTRSLRLATTSLLLPIHHPFRIAAEVAMLDRLSGGRVILGLGRGFAGALFEAFGIDASTKLARFDECLEIVLRCWAGDSLTDVDARFFDLDAPLARRGSREEGLADPGRAFRPHQRPHPPLAVAAFGRKGLAQAARLGLPYLASPMEPFELIAENLTFHREQLASPAERVVPIMRVVFVSSDEACLARVRERLAAAGPRGGGPKLPKAMARAMASPAEERMIVGSTSEVVDRLGAYRRSLEMNLLIVRAEIPGAGPEAQRESMQRIVEEVLPALG